MAYEKTNNPVVAEVDCPICGEPLQALKINKNGLAYVYCRNWCKCTYNHQQTAKMLEKYGKTNLATKGNDHETRTANAGKTTIYAGNVGGAEPERRGGGRAAGAGSGVAGDGGNTSGATIDETRANRDGEEWFGLL
ncbi:hypothetical protein FACS1894186_7470 [Alphaproteobacteria bacterium]|nr:hypothetical protein FACS1894186_7470 [Alphaproteobacteria bacterium]